MANSFRENSLVDVTKEVPANALRFGQKDKNQKVHNEDLDVQFDEMGRVKIKIFRGHEDTVSSCQLIADDQKVLSASHDGSILLWGVKEDKHLQAYDGGHVGSKITMARASPDSTRFVSVGWDKKVNLWNMETGRILWTGRHNGMTTCCNFSHDGRSVITGSDLDATIKIWDTNTGELIQEIKDLHSSTITSCQFNMKDDRIITTSMDMSTKFYDLKSQCNTITLQGHINIISDASLSLDERKLSTVSWDKAIHIWDVSTGMYRSQGPSALEKAHEGCISSCDISHDGLLLVTGGYDQQVCIWDVENMVQKLRLQGHSDWVEDVCFSKDQKWCLSCSKDKTIRLWNIENTDNIPMVMEKRKAIGLKISNCRICGKPFSIQDMDSTGVEVKECVFCRLQTPDRNKPRITEDRSIP